MDHQITDMQVTVTHLLVQYLSVL